MTSTPPAVEAGGSAANPRQFPGANVVAKAAGAPPFGRLRNTWRALNESLETIERKHFDGNFLEAVSQAPRKVGERARGFGEELGSAAVKLVEEAQGRGPEGGPGAVGSTTSFPSAGGSREDSSSPRSSGAPKQPQLQQQAQQVEPDSPGSVPRLWQEREHLQAELGKEREMRRGRAAALNALDEAIRAMRTEVVEERRLVAQAEDALMVGRGRADSVEHLLEDMQEEHEKWQSQKASLESELQRYVQAAAAKARAERQANREGAWAREGPETEALKLAKMELAEILSAADEATLRSRQEATQLSREIEAAKEEQEFTRQRMELQAAPKGLRAAMSRLLKPRGRDDEHVGATSSREVASSSPKAPST